MALISVSGCILSDDAAPVAPVTASPTVDLQQGQLVGVHEGDLEVFRGIPYAGAPSGEGRWKPPSPPPNWSGVRDATAFGPSCIQPAVPERSLYYDPPLQTSEDCLTLNIWTQVRSTKAPVIVWIHGGSLRIGGSAQSMYDGSEFAGRGVVFVSLNYRLGALGWLAHPELNAESPDGISGNYGLLDQLAALEWVRDNISAFGGDPANVTVMGESAGALSLTYLLTSPKADGLFQKAIIQSPNSRNFPELGEAAYGAKPAEEIGASSLSAMGFASIEVAREATAQEITDRAGQAGFIPQGTIEGDVLPSQIIDSFDKGAFAKVPVIAGFNSGEVRSQRLFLPRKPKDYEAAIVARYGELSIDVLALYPGSDVDASMLATLRDGIYGWATERIVRKETEANQPAFMYVFDHCYPSAEKADLCAFHASELPFVFGALDPDQLSPNWPVPDGEYDQTISSTLLDYWTSFAATGQPESTTGPVWPTYGGNQAYLKIGNELEVGTNPMPGMFELHEELVGQRKAAGAPWFLNIGLGAPPLE
ncbi:MAG: carboxylesterase [Hyphomonadaceae bacterium BRH_c29]|nr:MAG: carboxylesterase [Hyphomonadaceae bacterium BRH_c29]